jgi:hypothetical protein
MTSVPLVASARMNGLALQFRAARDRAVSLFHHAIPSATSFSRNGRARPTVYFCKKFCILNIPEKNWKIEWTVFFKFNSRDGHARLHMQGFQFQIWILCLEWPKLLKFLAEIIWKSEWFWIKFDQIHKKLQKNQKFRARFEHTGGGRNYQNFGNFNPFI